QAQVDLFGTLPPQVLIYYFYLRGTVHNPLVVPKNGNDVRIDGTQIIPVANSRVTQLTVICTQLQVVDPGNIEKLFSTNPPCTRYGIKIVPAVCRVQLGGSIPPKGKCGIVAVVKIVVGATKIR